MSVQRWFGETEAVVRVLSELAGRVEPAHEGYYLPPSDASSDDMVFLSDEEGSALWQAAELLSRAYSVLLPMVQFEQSKAALNLPDVQREQPKPKKKAHLYGADGKPL